MIPCYAASDKEENVALFNLLFATQRFSPQVLTNCHLLQGESNVSVASFAPSIITSLSHLLFRCPIRLPVSPQFVMLYIIKFLRSVQLNTHLHKHLFTL